MNLTETNEPQQPTVDLTPIDLAPTYKKMATNIRDALALSRKLVTVLGSAHERMLNRDITALEELLETQVKLLNMLQLNASLREHYLKEVGLPSNRAGIEQFIALCAEHSSLDKIQRYWNNLGQYVEQCKILNQANGKLLSRLSASTNKIMNLMFTGHEPLTYNEHGFCEHKIG